MSIHLSLDDWSRRVCALVLFKKIAVLFAHRVDFVFFEFDLIVAFDLFFFDDHLVDFIVFVLVDYWVSQLRFEFFHCQVREFVISEGEFVFRVCVLCVNDLSILKICLQSFVILA